MKRGAETGSGFQDAINRTNDAYERAGRACITRKSIPGKYLIDRGDSRKGLSIPSISITQQSVDVRLKPEELHAMLGATNSRDRRKFVPESKAEPDYGGVIAPHGRAIFYDAKTTKREALDFDNLHAHQIIYLERTARAGAVAGFLVEFSKHNEVYFLPIQVLIKWRECSTRKSLPRKFFKDALSQALPAKGAIFFDYLAAIEKQEDQYNNDFLTLQISY